MYPLAQVNGVANFDRDAITASLAIPQDPNPAFLTPCYRVSPIADLLRMQTKSGTGSVRTREAVKRNHGVRCDTEDF